MAIILDMEQLNDTCFGSIAGGAGCRVLHEIYEGCGTCKCPFYKPEDCRAWIRVNKGGGAYLMPPEDYRREHEQRAAIRKQKKLYRRWAWVSPECKAGLQKHQVCEEESD